MSCRHPTGLLRRWLDVVARRSIRHHYAFTRSPEFYRQLSLFLLSDHLVCRNYSCTSRWLSLHVCYLHVSGQLEVYSASRCHLSRLIYILFFFFGFSVLYLRAAMISDLPHVEHLGYGSYTLVCFGPPGVEQTKVWLHVRQ